MAFFGGGGGPPNNDTIAADGPRMFQRIVQLAAWGAVVTIGVLSLVPGELRPHTGASGYLEHVAAYSITATLLSLGYPRRSSIVIIASLSIYAASLEIAQLYVPGRGASVSDWIAGSFGSLIGAVVATFILRFWLRSPDVIEEKAETDLLGP